jgi:hypothetical protein
MPAFVPATVAMAEPADSLRKSRRLIKHSPDPGGIVLQLFVAVVQIGHTGPKTLSSGTPRQFAVSYVPDVELEVEDTILRFNELPNVPLECAPSLSSIVSILSARREGIMNGDDRGHTHSATQHDKSSLGSIASDGATAQLVSGAARR